MSDMSVKDLLHQTALNQLSNKRTTAYGIDQKIIIDIGSLYIKFGLSGEASPRQCLPNRIYENIEHCPEGVLVEGDIKPLYQLVLNPFEIPEIYERFKEQVKLIFYRFMMSDYKHKRKVLIAENLLLPLELKNMIAAVLFEYMNVPSIIFAPSQLLAITSVGKKTGLVVDCGYLETTVLPISDYGCLLHSIKTMPCAGQDISNNLKKLIIENASISFDDGKIFPFSKYPNYSDEILTNYIIEDIKASVCFVGLKPDSTEIIYDEKTHHISYRSSASEIGYPIENRRIKILIPGWVRERAAEILFDEERNEASVISLIIDSIKSTPTDIRKSLLQNILLIGGTSMLPGFCYRVSQELKERLKEDHLENLVKEVTIIRSKFPANTATWIGGSILGSLKYEGQEVTLQQWNETHKVPDWSNYSILNEEENQI
ncbi:actin-like ATPase domain-containing protein [Piromyces finnis]|uniref:Actin-like ATPase domain-containing protein n=1 Tax=Piromyces finnis TaxID=1754191 RepID=A0A1Y1VBU4_9FUNG|nr:actin-like ATPase domain-containing protein [Piromyces finnis]|eukprot:ORX52226.1 actin-like ATPase domain-containing protein [Piromyces finnis]